MGGDGNSIANSRVGEACVSQLLNVAWTDRVRPERQYLDIVEQRSTGGVQARGFEIAPGYRVARGAIAALSEDPPPVSDHSEDAVVESRDVAGDHLKMEPAQFGCFEPNGCVEVSQTKKEPVR